MKNVMKIRIGIKDLAQTVFEDRKGLLLDRIAKRGLRDHIIPSASVSDVSECEEQEGCGREGGEWSVSFEEGDFSVKYNPEEKKIEYFNNPNSNAEWDALYLIRQTLDRQLQENGVVCFHSGAFALNGKGVLLFGGSGAGKTSIILCSAQRGFSYLGNECTAVDGRTHEIVAGTEVLVLKEDVIRRYYPEFQDKGRLVSSRIRVCSPEDVFLGNACLDCAPLKMIVCPAIKAENITSESSKNILKNELYHDSALFVSGHYLMGGISRASAPDLDTPKCRENRGLAIIRLVDDCPALSIEGSVDYILDGIEKNLK